MDTLKKAIRVLLIFAAIISISACKKIKKFTDDNPDLQVIQQGFKASAAIGYCASLSHMAFTGQNLPGNVRYVQNNPGEYSSSAIMYVEVNNANPLPFNSNIGDIIIAALWDESSKSGVMSIIFADINLINSSFKFYGIHTVPFIEEGGTGDVITVFAKQDIVIGDGNDTIMQLNMSKPQFNLETERTRETPPSDPFVAVLQNVWFIKVDQNSTPGIINDNVYTISGGGQLAEASGDDAGIQYHALIEAEFNYQYCPNNPISGTGFIQNIKAGTGVDLGNITLDFHDICDGQAYVTFAMGTYLPYARRDVNLNFN